MDEPTQLEPERREPSPEFEPVTKVEDVTEDVLMSEPVMSYGTEDEVTTPLDGTVQPPVTPLPDPPKVVQEQVQTIPKYQTRYIMSGHTRSISSVKFNPEGTILASAGERVSYAGIRLTTEHASGKIAADKTIKLWDVEQGELIRTLEGHTEGISDIAWSHNGEYLASASDDKTIGIWSIESVGRLS